MQELQIIPQHSDMWLCLHVLLNLINSLFTLKQDLKFPSGHEANECLIQESNPQPRLISAPFSDQLSEMERLFGQQELTYLNPYPHEHVCSVPHPLPGVSPYTDKPLYTLSDLSMCVLQHCRMEWLQPGEVFWGKPRVRGLSEEPDGQCCLLPCWFRGTTGSALLSGLSGQDMAKKGCLRCNL